MPREISYGSFVRELSVQQDNLSYNELVPSIEYDENGEEIPYRPPRLALRPLDIYRLTKPYLSVRFNDQFKAVTPLAVYLVIFQLFILRQGVQDSWLIGCGYLRFDVVHGGTESWLDAIWRGSWHISSRQGHTGRGAASRVFAGNWCHIR